MVKVIHVFLILSLLLGQGQNCLAGGARGFYNYELKDGHTVVYRGQSNDLKRRELEHTREGKEFTHMKKVGKAKTKEGALKAEREALKTYRKSHGGANPKYNKTNHG